MGATLTAPDTALSHKGTAGRSTVLAEDLAELRGIPVASVARTVLDLARETSDAGLARCVRESIRLGLVTLAELGDALRRYPRRRGSRRLAKALARYSGLPLERARSGAEVRALEILHAAGRPLPKLNVRIAGEEADLSWASERLSSDDVYEHRGRLLALAPLD